MTTAGGLPWLWATLLAIALSSAHLLDGPTDDEAANDQAADLSSAIKSEAARARFTRAASQLCANDGATAHDQDHGTVQCHHQSGHRAAKVAAL